MLNLIGSIVSFLGLVTFIFCYSFYEAGRKR